MLRPIEPHRLREAVLADDPPLDERSKGEQIGTPRLSLQRPSNDRYDQITRPKAGNARTDRLNSSQTLVSQNQSIFTDGRPGLRRQENLSIGPTDAKLQRSAQYFARCGCDGRLRINKDRSGGTGLGSNGDHGI